MIVHEGREWHTGGEVREQCGPGLTDARLRQWKHRGRITGVRVGRVNYYDLDSVLDAEAAARRGAIQLADP